MTLYRYAALSPDGRKRSGQVEAANKEGARRQITASGDRLIELKDATKSSWKKLERRTRISPLDAGEFATELAGLLGAGAPLRKALDIQASGTGASSKLAAAVRRSIDNGGSLSAGLAMAGGGAATLSQFAEAGEAGAGLDALLANGGRFLKARSEALSKIRNALAYPFFILILTCVALSVITLFVAPALAPTLQQSGQGGFIIFLASVGEFIKDHSQVILVVLALSIALVFLIARKPFAARKLNNLIWSLPGIGSVARDLDVGQSCSVLAALLETGRPLESALKYAASVSGPRLAVSYSNIAQRLRDGEIASSAFNSETSLPLEVRRLALLGERSSAFARAMAQAGELCHARAMRRIDRIAAITGPVMVIGLGAAVSLLMLSVLGSLSSIGDAAL